MLHGIAIVWRCRGQWVAADCDGIVCFLGPVNDEVVRSGRNTGHVQIAPGRCASQAVVGLRIRQKEQAKIALGTKADRHAVHLLIDPKTIDCLGSDHSSAARAVGID